MTTPDAAALLALVARDVLTDVVEASLLELSWGKERHVRTPGGVRMYNQPIGTLITFHMRKKARETHGTSAEASEHADQDTSRGPIQKYKDKIAAATAKPQPPPKGAQAVHPGVRAPIKKPGDTISGLAYKHTPKPSGAGYPWAQPQKEQPQVRELSGPGGMRGRVNPDGTVETMKWDGTWGPAADPEHVANTWHDVNPDQHAADKTAKDHVSAAMLEHFTAKVEAAAAKRYVMPKHTGPLTDKEVQDRLHYIERTTSDAMHDNRSTDWSQALNAPGTQLGWVWKPGRATQHNAIVKELMAKYADVPREGKGVIAGGVPGAGKSTVLKSLPDQYMPIDADQIKGMMADKNMIPKLKGLSPMEAAPLVHEESRQISALLAQRAYAEHRNVAWDITMAGGGSPNRHLEDMRKAGYGDVQALYVDVNPQEAIKRTQSRYRTGLEQWRAGKGEGGRYLPASAITGNAAGSRGVFDSIKGKFDGASTYDTSKGKPELTSHYAPLTNAEYAEHAQKTEDTISAALKAGKSTDHSEVIKGKQGVWKPERAELHNKIVDAYLRDSVHVPSNGHALISGGLGGAGKSTVLNKYAEGVDQRKFVTVNPDDIKERMAAMGMVPKIKGLSPMEASVLVHEEASYVANLVAQEMYRRKKNVIWDITMSSPGSVNRRLDEMRKAGYSSIGAVFVHIPVETSVERARARHRRGLELGRQGKGDGGRFVPSGVIRASATTTDSNTSLETFQKLRQEGKFDAWQLFDNSGSKPKLVDKHLPYAKASPVLSTEEIVRQASHGKKGSKKQEKAAWWEDAGQTYKDQVAETQKQGKAQQGTAPAVKKEDTLKAQAAATEAQAKAQHGTAVEGNAVHDVIGKPKLTPAQKTAVKSYGSAGYMGLNAWLRSDRSIPAVLSKYKATPEQADGQVTQLDNLFNAAKPLEQPVTTYRGMKLTAAQMKPGTEFTDKAYVSTSSDLAVADEFGYVNGKKASIVRVHVPAGTKALSVAHAVGDDPNAPSDPQSQEKEVLLPRGSTFKVTGTSKVNGLKVTDVEMVPPSGDLKLDTKVSTPDKAPEADTLKAQAAATEKQAKVSQGSAKAVKKEDTLKAQAAATEKQAQAQHGTAKPMGKKTQTAVDRYTSQHYSEINDALRQGKMPKGQEALVATLDKAFADAEPLKQPLVVYRGVQDMGRDQERVVVPGGRIFDRAFVSTSTDAQFANSIGDRGTVIKITIPAGTKVLRPNDAEGEVLLPRGTKLKIRTVASKKEGPFSFRHVEADLLPVQPKGAS